MKPTEALELAFADRIRLDLIRTERNLDHALQRLTTLPRWRLLARDRAARDLQRAFDDRTDAAAAHRDYLHGLTDLPLCDRCTGTGINNGGVCPHCHGTGRYHVGGFPVAVHPDAEGFGVYVPPDNTSIARNNRTRDAGTLKDELDRRANVDRPPTWQPPTRPEERL